MRRSASAVSRARTSGSKRGWLPARFDTIRIEDGAVVRLNGEVGEVRKDRSLVRMEVGRSVVLGGLRVLSLSSTRARIVGLGCFSDSVPLALPLAL